jgi:hypothetical protein
MKLDAYISETLLAIVNGIEKAQKEIDPKSNAKISPAASSTKLSTGAKGYAPRIEEVEFDVALTIESGTQTKGGIGVLSGVVNLGSAGQSASSQVAVNKIKFSVPIELPYYVDKK